MNPGESIGTLWNDVDSDFVLSLVENSPVPIVTVDETGTILFASGATADVLGYLPRELVGQSLTVLIADDLSDDRLRELRNQLTDGDRLCGSAFEFTAAQKGGKTLCLSASFSEHVHGNERVFTGVLRELSGTDGEVSGTDEFGCPTFRNAVEQAGHAIWVTDTDGTIEYVNPAFVEITGYTAAEAIGRQPDILNSGEMSEAHFEALWETIQAGEIWEEEIVNRRKSGETYHAHQTIAPVFDDDEIVQYVAIQTDITDRKATERDLQRYREVVQRLDDPIMLQNLDGEFELLNDATAERAGYSREQLLETDEFLFMDEKAAETIAENKAAVLDDEAPLRYEVSPTFDRTGETATFSTKRYPYHDNGDLVGTIAICRDVTPLKEREETLRQYKLAIDGTTDLISATDRDGRYLFANPQYCAYHGIDPDTVTDLTLEAVFDGDQYDRVIRHVDRALDGEHVRYRTVRQHPSWGNRSLDVRYYPLEDDGEITGVVAVFRDVTDNEERTKQLQVVDRVLRHNLRNELTVIRGRAEQIAERVGANDPDAEGSERTRGTAESDGESVEAATDSELVEAATDSELVEAATDIVEHADRLMATGEKSRNITHVLNDAPERSEVDLASLVRRIADSAEREHPALQIDVAGPDRLNVTTTSNLERAIEELVENTAVHSDRDAPSVELRIEPGPETVRVSVVDDGPGMSSMDRDVLSTGRPPESLYHGSGLGLWLVYWVVRRSGGSIEVADVDPRGTAVTIELPRSPSRRSGSSSRNSY